MQNHTTKYPNLKQLELLVWRICQFFFIEIMKRILEDLDAQIAQERDTQRFRMKEKSPTVINSLFGAIPIKRNYYFDQKAHESVYLLDRYLEFEGRNALSPLVEEVALALAINGPSYRKAAETLEKFLGYRVISHEAIRQHLMASEVLQKARETVHSPVLFVEVDGLYIKHQRQSKRGKEEKIAVIHQGWETNGKRVRLKHKRHFVHDGEQPFWEAFEKFLMDEFDYDPTKHKLVINGDGAKWITACREYFKERAFYCMDRFHLAREIRRLCRKHPRYRQMQEALEAYDSQRLLTELNSAVGTLQTAEQEARLEQLIQQIEKHPQAVEDYRQWLQEQGIDTTGMRPMGSAESTMHVFAKRLKQGRSWSEKGARAMMRGLVARLDNLGLKTLFGRVEAWPTSQEEDKPPKCYAEKVTKTFEQVARDNIPYLKNKANLPVYRALKGLVGF
ncbi:ISLre2 family transposase [Caldalkalibacillus thermarum TA2.A1]|uniref:ISLre2 family transposase n=1 Tax=Caldalkalibacillus thermarum (strain TA2.A1) TaxID=986075 RepID=A0A8X8I7U0_CALTT|nr:ISLre2 family transposase [Caldalkalibacillus thermarum]QZT32998.1 ISLre2 family transposase [Caldalkalibacillus thermarum TA2.A1]QZT34703.1 ISLre2 family transposase [Caldalkalibacillus thermarum TA2.A1]